MLKGIAAKDSTVTEGSTINVEVQMGFFLTQTFIRKG